MEYQTISLHFNHRLNRARLRYTCDFLERHPLANGQLKIVFNADEINSLRIDYQLDSSLISSYYSMPAQQLLFDENKKKHSHLFANSFEWKSQKLYAVESVQKGVQAFLKDKNFQFDILETIFFHISRYEEWQCGEEEKDQWDMMEEERQFLVAHGLEQQPIVDQLVFAFFEAIGLKPERLQTRYRITHDIDEVIKFKSPYTALRASAGLLLKGKGLPAYHRLWTSYLNTLSRKQPDPYDTFDWMLWDQSSHERLIYFLVGGDTTFDHPFDLHSTRMQQILGLCHERGYLIGLHPSYASWKDKALLNMELQVLSKVINQQIMHSRQHYLHFSFQETPYILEEAGIAEDSSLGYNNRIGFRCGTGFPYRLYDFKNEEAFNFTEVPLVFMDSALLRQGNYDAALIQQLFDKFLSSNSENTFITFNFHNSRFDDAWIKGIPLRELYGRLNSPAI